MHASPPTAAPRRAASTPPRGKRAALTAALALALACAPACTRDVRRFPDGTPRWEGARSLLHGTREGRWRWWFPGGGLREEGTYSADRRVGTWTLHWPGGGVRERGVRVPDPATPASHREGLWSAWHPDGRLRSHGLYVAGQRQGPWIFWLDDGGLDGLRSGEYLDGRRVR